MMLAARGHLVAMEKAKNFHSRGEDWAENLDFIGVGGGKAKLGWLIEDLNAEGACGNAAAATREAGEILLESAAKGLAAFLREVDGFSADGLEAHRD